MSFLFGSPSKIKTGTTSPYNPEQQALLQKGISTVTPSGDTFQPMTPSAEDQRFFDTLQGQYGRQKALINNLYSPEAPLDYYERVMAPRLESMYPSFSDRYSQGFQNASVRGINDVLFPWEQARMKALTDLEQQRPSYDQMAAEYRRQFLEPTLSPNYRAFTNLMGIKPVETYAYQEGGQPGALQKLLSPELLQGALKFGMNLINPAAGVTSALTSGLDAGGFSGSFAQSPWGGPLG